MFQTPTPRTGMGSGIRLATLIYHSTVRQIRKSHGNAVIGLLLNMMQTIILVIAFYFMFAVLGLRSNAIRGDFPVHDPYQNNGRGRRLRGASLRDDEACADEHHHLDQRSGTWGALYSGAVDGRGAVHLSCRVATHQHL